jgi:hypothetical protein
MYPTMLLLSLLANQPGPAYRDNDSYWWVNYPNMSVPEDKRTIEQVDSPTEKCAEYYGGNDWVGGCVGHTIEWEDGPWAHIVMPKGPISEHTLKHESRHADGWFHPTNSGSLEQMYQNNLMKDSR